MEVESLSVNGVKFRATDGFPETGFDGAKFTLLLTHNMKIRIIIGRLGFMELMLIVMEK